MTTTSADTKSRWLLKTFLDEFSLEAVKEAGCRNIDYLDFQIKRLESMRTGWDTTSRNLSLSVRKRQRARDLAQNAAGLLAGLKFGISFIVHQDKDLDADVPGVKERRAKVAGGEEL